jgi:hypothetical protein
VLSLLDTDIGPIFTHGAVEPINALYREAGLKLPLTNPVSAVKDKNLVTIHRNFNRWINWPFQIIKSGSTPLNKSVNA